MNVLETDSRGPIEAERKRLCWKLVVKRRKEGKGEGVKEGSEEELRKEFKELSKRKREWEEEMKKKRGS